VIDSREDIRSLKVTLAVYLLIFVMKLGAFLASHVVAVLAEALHTLSDIFISGFLLVATVYSRRAADRIHMFGYGRAQNIAALVAATLFISFTSFELYREAIPRLFRHEAATYQNLPLALGVLAASMLVAAAPLVSLLRQKTRGAAAKAQMLELVNDELGLLAALLGTLFVLWGFPVADPIAAMVVATIIAVNAVSLFRENSSFLLGRAPEPALIARLEAAARSVPGVLGVHHVRAELIGPGVAHADIHIQVAPTLSVVEAHAIAISVDRLLEPILGNGIAEVHVDPQRAE
jgi:cation diffusion facilitator family transporter